MKQAEEMKIPRRYARMHGMGAQKDGGDGATGSSARMDMKSVIS